MIKGPVKLTSSASEVEVDDTWMLLLREERLLLFAPLEVALSTLLELAEGVPPVAAVQQVKSLKIFSSNLSNYSIIRVTLNTESDTLCL